MDYIKLTADPLSVDEVTKLVTDPSCGAISIFAGTTRNVFEGQTVVQLEYESYEGMAEKEIKKLCNQAREKWALKHIAVYHRLGLVPVSEASVLLAVSSVHRRESLDAVSFLIDALKANVPIWKKEVYEDGSGDWKQNKECVWSKKDGTGGNTDGKENRKNAKRTLEVTAQPENEPLLKKIKTEPLDVSYPSDEAERACAVDETTIKVKEEITDDKNSRCYEYEEAPKIDPQYVQIVASKDELSRRIKAFQQCKREELDVLNVQEFCTMSGSVTSLSSCARSSAVVLRSKDSKSHLKLTRVVNEWGPQTLGKDPGSMSSSIRKPKGKPRSREKMAKGKTVPTVATPTLRARPSTRNQRSDGAAGVAGSSGLNGSRDAAPPGASPAAGASRNLIGLDERIHNLETHMKIGLNTPVPRDIYARLKAIEDRVLHLEGVSPEYFGTKNMKLPEKDNYKKEVQAVEDDLSVHELDMRIHELRMKLKERQLKRTF